MGARCQVCEGDVRASYAGRRGQGPRGVGDVSKDSFRCMGDVNGKGHGVRHAWAAGEGLRPGCSSPQRAIDVECGVGRVFNLFLPSRRCCHAPPRPPLAPGSMTGPVPYLSSARQARAAYACAPRRPRAPSLARTRRRRRHLQPPRPRLAHPQSAPREGSTPRPDWLLPGQSALETSVIGGHEAYGQPPKPIADGQRWGHWERPGVPRWSRRVLGAGRRGPGGRRGILAENRQNCRPIAGDQGRGYGETGATGGTEARGTEGVAWGETGIGCKAADWQVPRPVAAAVGGTPPGKAGAFKVQSDPERGNPRWPPAPGAGSPEALV